MENRLQGFFGEPEEEYVQETPLIEIDIQPGERLMRITLEMADENGLLDNDLPEDYEGEAFIEETIIVREREFESFVKVLHYNKLRYRVETLR